MAGSDNMSGKEVTVEMRLKESEVTAYQKFYGKGMWKNLFLVSGAWEGAEQG